MNENGVLISRDEIETCIQEGYKAVKKEGEYILHLDHRAWNLHRGFGMICYFTDRKNHKYQLYLWRQDRKFNGIYSPKDTPVDFSIVKDGTWWKCIVRKNFKGRLEWREAEEVISAEHSNL